jgi:hypothetical protein
MERQRKIKEARKRWVQKVEEMIAAGKWHKDKKY